MTTGPLSAQSRHLLPIVKELSFYVQVFLCNGICGEFSLQSFSPVATQGSGESLASILRHLGRHSTLLKLVRRWPSASWAGDLLRGLYRHVAGLDTHMNRMRCRRASPNRLAELKIEQNYSPMATSTTSIDSSPVVDSYCLEFCSQLPCEHKTRNSLTLMFLYN